MNIQHAAVADPTHYRLFRTMHETPCMRHGKPSYRWAPHYHVITPTGGVEYPPLMRADAYARARELGAKTIEVIG